MIVELLKRKGVISQREIDELRRELNEKLKPRNILSEKELREVVRRLRHLSLPEPKGWAESLWVGAHRKEIEQFASEKVYRACGLRNLVTVLHTAGVRNESVFEKLEKAARLAEEYGME